MAVNEAQTTASSTKKPKGDVLSSTHTASLQRLKGTIDDVSAPDVKSRFINQHNLNHSQDAQTLLA